MERERFGDRAEAGRLLADRLRHYAGRDDVIVLAVPRAGVPVGTRSQRRSVRRWTSSLCASSAYPATRSLRWALSPAAGSIVVNPEALEALPISEADIHRAAAAELRELERRE